MKSQFPDAVLHRVERCGVIAVLVIDEVDHAVPVARSLCDGGIDVMELTLRTPAAIDALAAIRAEVPEMLAGIGTILRTDQVQAVYEGGAAFGVSPGTNRRVVEAAQCLGLPFAPGVATPSELEIAVELGCREVKFFPAEPLGGLDYLRAMAAPYAHLGVRFFPLGGLKVENMGSYLIDPLTLGVGGSWLAPRALIRSGDWLAIRDLAAAARLQVDKIRAFQNQRDTSS